MLPKTLGCGLAVSTASAAFAAAFAGLPKDFAAPLAGALAANLFGRPLGGGIAVGSMAFDAAGMTLTMGTGAAFQELKP